METYQIVDLALAGESEVTQRDRDQVRRAVLALRDAGLILEPESQAVVVRDAGERPDLPAPRLQLRWEDHHTCHYELVLPVSEHDIRRERYDGADGVVKRSRFLAIPLGGTKRTGSRSPLTQDKDGREVVDTPYRDGCHILWDAARLKLPAFAVWGERVTELKPQLPPADAAQ